MSLSRSKLIMTIYPNARGFAYIVFDGPLSPVDWGITDLRGAKKKEACIRRVDKLLKILYPDVLVLRDTVGLGRRCGQLCMLIPIIEEIAKQRGIATMRVSRREIRRTFAFLGSPTRSTIVQTIAKHIPVFDRYYMAHGSVICRAVFIGKQCSEKEHCMAFVRTKIVKGRIYRSLEERYREKGKVKSRYIRSLNDGGIDRSLHGYAGEFSDMQQGAAQLEARDKAAAEKSASSASAADSGQENAASDKESGEESDAA